MAILGTIALIALVVLGIMVLRLKSDPMENESVRKYLSDAAGTNTKPSSLTPPVAKPDSPRSTD